MFKFFCRLFGLPPKYRVFILDNDRVEYYWSLDTAKSCMSHYAKHQVRCAMFDARDNVLAQYAPPTRDDIIAAAFPGRSFEA